MPRYLSCVSLYSWKHRLEVQINSKTMLSKSMLISQQHKYSLKQTLPSSSPSAFLSASKYFGHLLSVSVLFPQECAGAAWFCRHINVMDIFIQEIRSCLQGSSVSHCQALAFGDWHIKKWTTTANPYIHLHPGSVSLTLVCLMHTHTHAEVFVTAGNAVEELQLHY